MIEYIENFDEKSFLKEGSQTMEEVIFEGIPGKEVIYLFRNYNGTFCLCEENTYKDEVFDYDYTLLADWISPSIKYKELENFIKENYPIVKKIVLVF